MANYSSQWPRHFSQPLASRCRSFASTLHAFKINRSMAREPSPGSNLFEFARQSSSTCVWLGDRSSKYDAVSSLERNKIPHKRLTVKRPSNSGFGFSIRGGAEHGIGLYVSSVDKKSVAEKEVVLPGDHVIQVNGTRNKIWRVNARTSCQGDEKFNFTANHESFVWLDLLQCVPFVKFLYNGLETKISRTFLDFLHLGHEFFVISGHGT